MLETLTAEELDLLYQIHETIACPLLDSAMPAVTKLGDNGLLWISVAVVLLYFPRSRRTGCQMALAMALCFVFGNGLLKLLIARERPFDRDPALARALLIEQPAEYSFPSAHTMNGFAAAMSLWFRHSPGRMPAVAMASLIAFSRVYLRVHYPSDVAAGALLGTGSAWLSGKIVSAWSRRRRRKSHG